jgi:FkbM family methyltransferase
VQLLATSIAAPAPFDLEAKILRAITITPRGMIDIGAHVGVYASVLEDIVGAQNLYLFEPLPTLYRRLRWDFRGAHVFATALSDQSGPQQMRVPFINGQRVDSRATLNQHHEPAQTATREITVHRDTLDALAQRNLFGPVGLIKIDVEGHELAVINGATQFLTTRQPLLLIEIEARHHQFPIATIFGRLEALGYRGYYANPQTATLLPVHDFVVARDQDPEAIATRQFSRYLNNFFFVPVAKEAQFVAEVRAFLAEA